MKMAFTKVYINRMLWFQGVAAQLDDKMVNLRSSYLVCVVGFDSGFLSARVDVGVSGPFPCIPSFFRGHLPLSVSVPIVVVVVVVVPGGPVVMVRALFVAFIMVLLTLFGPVVSCVSCSVSGLLTTSVVVMVMVVVVVPVWHWLVALLLLGMSLS